MTNIIGGHEAGLLDSSLTQLNRNDSSRNGSVGSGEESFVNVSNGNLVLRHRDVFMPSRGEDFTIVRTYNSRAASSDAHQHDDAGWTISTGVYLDRLNDATGEHFSVTYGDGSVFDFRYDTTRQLWVSVEGAGAFETIRDLNVSDPAAPAYILTRADGTQLTFNKLGHLLSSVDTNGVRMDYEYASDKLQRIRDDEGHVISFVYSEGHLEKILDETGAVLVQYKYASGRLVEVIDRMGHSTRYSYNSFGVIERVDLPSQQIVGGQVESYTQRSLKFEYQPFNWNGPASGREYLLTSLTDAEGGVTSFQYDMQFTTPATTKPSKFKNPSPQPLEPRVFQGGVTRTVDALGNNRAYSNDQIYRQWRVANGFYEYYDAQQASSNAGYQLQVDAIRLQHTTTYVINKYGNIAEVTDQEGYKTSYTYDEQENLTSIADRNGYGAVNSDSSYYRQLRAEFGLVDAGGLGKLVAELTAAEKNALLNAFTTRFTYDSQGNLLSRTDNTGNVTKFTYTSFNKVATSTTAEGTALITSDDTQFQRKRVELGYAALVADLTAEDKAALTELYTTHYAYDAKQNLIQRTDAGGDVTRFEYDVYGNLTRRIVYLDKGNFNNPATQQVTQFFYDLFGNNIETVDAEGNRTYRQYDHFGNLTRSIDGRGGVTTYTYDADDRVLSVTDPEGHTTYNTYDSVGNRISFRDANGHLTIYTYDRNNMLLSTIDNADFGADRDRVTRYSYDVVGNQTSVTDAEGRKTTYLYNNRRQMVEIISAAVADEYGVTRQYSSTFSYDGEGNRVRMTNNRGNATDFLYNRDGLLIQQVDASGHVTRYTYDANRNQIMIVAGMQLPVEKRQVIRFAFDEEDQLVAQTDAEGGITRTTYTATGMRELTTDANLNGTKFEYDRNNRLVREIRAAVTDPVTGQLVNYTVEHQYDANGNEVARTDENGHTTRFAFDRDNKLVMVTDGNGIKTVYGYDSRHNRTSIAIGVDAYLDADGRVIINAAADAQVTTFAYDEFNQLVAKTDGVGNALADNDGALYQAMRQKMGYAAAVADLGEAEKNALRNAYTDRYAFDRVGNLTSTTDHLGNKTTREYDSLNRLVRQTDALGSSTTSGYDGNGNRVWQRDALGRLIAQAYDQVDRLVSATDPLGIATVRKYDAFSNLIEQTRAAGTSEARTSRFEYDLNNRLVRSIDPEGHLVSYEYDAVGNRLKVVDARGNASRHVFDALNRNVRIIDPLSFETRIEYDGVGNRISLLDARGGLRRMQYDAGNRLIQTTDAEGRVTRYEYDVRGNQITMRTAFGTADEEVTRFEYDAQNNLRAVVDAEGHHSANDFDRVYNRVAATDGNGHTTVTEFDAVGRVLGVTNAEGEKTTYSYDAVGNRLTQTDALGRVTSFVYDANNRVILQRAADGIETRYAYDKAGNRISVTVAANTAEAATTTFVYNLDDQLIEQTDPLGHRIRYEYDENHNRTSVIDAEGHATRYVYDANNRVTSIIDALGNTVQYRYDGNGNRVQITDARGHVSTTYYNANNEVVLAIDNEGYATETQYDNNGNVIATTLRAAAVGLPVTPEVRPALVASAMDRTTRFNYDKLNRLIEKTDAEGYVTRFAYDAVGNRVRTELFLDLAQTRSEVTRAWYDDVNRQVALVSAEGYLTTFTYDDAGNRIGRTQYDQRAAFAADGMPQPIVGDAGRTTRYEYDSVNQLVRETSPLGVATAYEYDDRGNRTAVVEAAGTADQRRKEFRYDAAGRLTDEVDAHGTVTHYELDADGNILARFDASGTVDQRIARFEYDALHRVVRETNPLGVVTESTYDAAGNVLARTTAAGLPEARTERFEYDRNNRTVAAVNGEDERAEYAYDAAGNRIRETRAPGLSEERSTHYEYDRDNRLIATVDPAGTRTESLYDGAGNTIETIQARGVFGLERHAYFSYDLDNRLIQATDAMGGVTRYEYDALGNQTRIINANGGIQVNTFDALGRMVTSLSAGGILTRNTYDLRNNITGTTQSWADGSDARTTTYRYDLLNRQVSVTDGEGYSTAITYDKFGNQTRIEHGLYLLNPGDAGYSADKAARAFPQTNSFVYDQANRMLSMTDAEGNLTAYVYDAVGNRTGMTEAANSAPRTTRYTYDLANRLVETHSPEGGIARSTYNEVGDKIAEDLLQSSGPAGSVWVRKVFEYDPVGRLAAEVDPYGVRTEHVYDAVGNKIAVRSAAGTPDQRVVRMEYDLNNRKTADIDAENNRTVYAYDSMGNRTKVIDALGRVARYYYDGANQLTTLVDPENFVSTFAYDAAGNQTESRLYMTRLAGSPDDRAAPAATPSAADRVTRTVYNRVNKAIAQIASDGTRNEIAYDGARNMVRETLYANTDAPHIRDYRYDLNNRLVHFVDIDGTVTTFTYDGANNRTSQVIISSTDPNAVRATYMRYDLNNRKVAETFDPNGLNIVQTIEYDKLGNVVRKTDGNGHATVYSYDLNNRLGSETNALGLSTRYDYDRVGNRIAVTDARGYTTNFEYDGNNRVSKEIRPLVDAFTISGGSAALRPTTVKRYDAAGNEVQTVDANGYTTTRYFDGNNRLVAEINADNVLTEYSYNAAGEKTATALYMSRLAAVSHDPLNRPAAPSGDVRLTRQEFDLAGRLVRVVHPATEITTLTGADTENPQAVTVLREVEELISYDGFGNAVVSVDKNGNRSFAYYDVNGRKTAVVDGAGYLTEWDYDAQDNVLEQRIYTAPLDASTLRPGVKPTQPNGEVYISSRRYDAASRLVEERSPQIQVFDPVTKTSTWVRPTTLYTYDAIGNETSRTIAAGTSQAQIEYSYYDAGNRKVAVINANRVVHLYQFDANGNQTLRKRFFNPVDASINLATLNGDMDFAALVAGTAADQATQFSYDALNRMSGETDLMGPGAADDLSKSYRYDALANRTAITDEDGYVSTNAYDGMNRVVQTVSADGSGTLAQFDAAGNQIYVFTGKMESRALPASNIGVTLNADLNVSWTIPGAAPLRSWVVYDTASRTTPVEYANRTAEFTNAASGSAATRLSAIGSTVYFRVVTEDIAGNQTWSEERVVSVPPRFTDASVRQPSAGTLEVSARFDAGAVNPTLYYGPAQNPTNAAAFTLQADGSYKATLTGIANPQDLSYRFGWADAAGRSYSSAETTFASAAEHVGISSDVSQGVVSATDGNRYTMQVQSRVPASLANRLQVVQAQWRPAGSNSGYAATAVQGADSGSGYVTYTLVLGDDSPLAAGDYEVVLTGAAASEEVLLDTFNFTVGADAAPKTVRSLAWSAPPAGDSQLVTIDGKLVQASRVDGRLTVDANPAAGAHNYDVLYTQAAATTHAVSTSATAITQMIGTPPAPQVTGYNLQINANFDSAEAARIAGDVRFAYRPLGASAFGAETAMTSAGTSGYTTTLADLPTSGQYEIRISYTDIDGNDVVADWLTVSANADLNFTTRSQTVLARETGGSYQVGADGLIQVAPGLYTGPLDESLLAATLSLDADATGSPAGTLAADGSTTGYFIEHRYNALNAKIASNEQDGLWRFYGVDGNGNAVQTRLIGTQPDLKTPASNEPPVVSYAAFDARNRKVADFGVAFTRHGEADARFQVSRSEYNVLDKVVAQTDALGNVRRSEYNAAGIQVRETDAAGYSKSILIDVLGHETAVVDALGHTSTKFYDSLGRLARDVDATGYETRYSYDVFDRRTAVTNGLGALTAVDGDHTTRFHHDNRDRLVQIEQSQGWHLANDYDAIYEEERVRLGYTAYVNLVDQTALAARAPAEPVDDGWGNLIMLEPAALSEAEREAARATLRSQGIHGVLDLLSSAQRAELAALYTQQVSYDGRNNRTSMTDANGHVTREVYDALGRVVDTITMQNGVEVHNRRGYDAYGNLITEIDGDGRTTTRRYAGFARLVEEIDAGGVRTSYQYDRLGNQTGETSTEGKSITRDYDHAGHLLKITDTATGVSTVFGYNGNGARVLERITTPDNAHNRDILYQYDAVGRQVRWADSVTGLHLNYAWDAAGNQKRVYTDAGYAHAVDHSYRYDDANRVTGIDNTGGSLIADYRYDAAGNRIRYNNGTAVVDYTYDSLGRVLKGVQGDKASSWTYDRAGNVLRYVAEDGKASTYKYYENNRNWYSQSGEQETIQALDLAGHVTQMTLHTKGKTYYYTYTYLADGREQSIRGYGAASGNSVSQYDVNHNRIAVNRGRGDGMDRAEISTFVYSNEDKILYRYHDTGKGGEIESTEYLYANGYQVGETGTDTQGQNKTQLDVGRYNLVQNIDNDWPGTAVTTYTAREGDTLQSIAGAVYGNPNLWYLLADANGLSPNDRIKAGTEIRIPNSARTGELNADTHAVYNESEIIGSTLPNLKSPPPKKKKGCAQFLMIVIVIVIAVVAWWAVSQLGPVIGAALGGGTATAGTTLAGYAIAGVIVGAAASVVQQGLFIALGFQEKFSWKSVAAGAISGAFTGAAQGMQALAALGKAAEITQYAKVASAALEVAGAAAKQLIENGKITSWSSLAMAGMGGYARTGAAEVSYLAKTADTLDKAQKAADLATHLGKVGRITAYASPWVQLAETAIRNDGKLQASDWANAVGATFGAALSSTDMGEGLLKGFEPTQQRLIGNLLVGGAMAAISKTAAKDYLINAAADWTGRSIGDSIVGTLEGWLKPNQYAGASAGSSGSNGVILAADRKENEEQQMLGSKRGTKDFVRVADSGTVMSDIGNSYGDVDFGKPVQPTSESDAMYNALVDAMQNPSPASGQRIMLDDFGNPVADGLQADRTLENILRERNIPVEVAPDGTVHYFNIDRSTGLPIAKPGSEISSFTREDGVTVREHIYTRPDGTKVLLGTDYGTPVEYVRNQPDDVGGDPIHSLRRQVALSPEYADLASQYIDRGSGQVDPAKWKDFIAAAQQQGLKMIVTSNGIDNPYYQGRDNAMSIAGGYSNALTINVYNPTNPVMGSAVLGDVGGEAAAAVLFNQRQSVQVAIQNQMVEALQYNNQLMAVQKTLGVDMAPFRTTFIGHSQGTINGNRAIERMAPEQQDQIQLVDIGRYYPWAASDNIGSVVTINDRHDGSRFASSWMANDPNYENNPKRQYIWTDFNTDKEGPTGNNHSLYLYLQRSGVQKALGMRPQSLTQPFVNAAPSSHNSNMGSR